MIHVFPAVFQAADEGYNVRFPDLDGMFTSGDSLEEAVELAQEMLPAVLCEMEDYQIEILEATEIDRLVCDFDEIAANIEADTAEYRDMRSAGSKA